MSNNEEFVKLYKQTRDNHITLHNMILEGLKVWFVEQGGHGEVCSVQDCLDFAALTDRGSVLITDKHGTFLKVDGQYWVNINYGEVRKMKHDLDIINILLSEGDKIATVIDPGV